MQNSWIAVTGMAVGMAALAGCSDSAIGSGPDDTDNGPAVSLATADDVLRELGNLGSGFELELGSLDTTASATGGTGGSGGAPSAVRLRARLAAAMAPRAATPVSTACSSGGTDLRTTDSKSRTFSYFTYTGTMNDQLDVFSNCASNSDGSTQNINGNVESGSDTASDMLYAVLGTGSTAIQLSSGDNGGSISRNLLGTVEAQQSSGNFDELRAVLQGSSNIQNGNSTVSWQLSLGQGGTPFDVLVKASALSFNGPYSYTGSTSGCTGGNVTVTTITPLAESSGSEDSFTGGVIGFSSGGKSVTVTVNADGSATLSGNVSGTLSKDQLNGALLNATCVPLDTLGG